MSSKVSLSDKLREMMPAQWDAVVFSAFGVLVCALIAVQSIGESAGAIFFRLFMVCNACLSLWYLRGIALGRFRAERKADEAATERAATRRLLRELRAETEQQQYRVQQGHGGLRQAHLAHELAVLDMQAPDSNKLAKGPSRTTLSIAAALGANNFLDIPAFAAKGNPGQEETANDDPLWADSYFDGRDSGDEQATAGGGK